jgi:hypothetical protein
LIDLWESQSLLHQATQPKAGVKSDKGKETLFHQGHITLFLLSLFPIHSSFSLAGRPFFIRSKFLTQVISQSKVVKVVVTRSQSLIHQVIPEEV